MITQIKQQVTNQQLLVLGIIAGISCIITGLVLLGNSYKQTLLPNTYIDSIAVSGLTREESIQLLKSEAETTRAHELVVSIDDITLASSSSDLAYFIDFEETVHKVYEQQHNTSYLGIAVRALRAQFQKNEVTAPKKYDPEKLSEFLHNFNTSVEIIGENPRVELKVPGSKNSVVVYPGKPGRTLDTQSSTQLILEALQENTHTVSVQVASTSSVLTQEEIEKTIARANLFVSEKLVLQADDSKFYLTDTELVSFIDPISEYQKDLILETITTWSEKVNRPAQDAVFSYNKDTLEVSEFVPHKDGIEVDTHSSAELITAWLQDLEAQKLKKSTQLENQENKENQNDSDKLDDPNTLSSVISLVLKKTTPQKTLAQTNDLGIIERIGFGESYYHHSIPNRVHNVDITAKRISQTIVPPGKEFSFNKTLGEISARTGYRSAYVISGGKTVLGDGGGVCQVSSTLFRSVLDAGLDVSKRLQHSYRVSYYELNSDPGFDATVYSGEVDFRFINDTPGHIIITAYNDPKELYMNMEIYGTNDGRISEISNYKQWGFVGAPASEYYPTTELPKGVTKQIDWAVSGIKAEFTHTVTKENGDVLHKDTYYSNYRPWSAKYMVGI